MSNHSVSKNTGQGSIEQNFVDFFCLGKWTIFKITPQTAHFYLVLPPKGTLLT